MPASDSPSTEVAERSPAHMLAATVRSQEFQGQIALALPDNVSPRRFVRIAATALLENPSLAKEIDHDSIFAALLKSAADGLLPDGREAALVAFKKKAVYLPMIGGYRKIAADHGWTLETAVVREGDRFEYELGVAPHLVHRPSPSGEKMSHAYAIARKTGEPTLFEVMSAEEIEKVRKTSRAKDSGPWVEWPERMYEKTVGRRLFKKLPLGDSERVRRVLNADELAPGEAENIVYGSPASGESPPAEALPEPSAAPREAEPSPTAPPPPFTGEEPPADEPDEKPVADELLGYRLGEAFKRYAGQMIADVVEAGDRKYLVWLTSEAVADQTVRDAARAGLKALDS